MTIITIPTIKEIHGCTERTALRKLKYAREKLGKKVNDNGRKGGDPVTVEQYYEVFGLNKKVF